MRLLVEEGSLEGRNIVQIGLRGYWPDPEDFEWARGQGFRWHLMEEISDRGMAAVMDDVVGAAKQWDHMFLSFDIDVCDPGFAPGTGTPEPGGITGREALRAVRRLALEVGFAGMEVVEVSPPYDHADVTAFLANRLVLEALSGLALRKLGREPKPERSS
jgi:arginase family enzyme